MWGDFEGNDAVADSELLAVDIEACCDTASKTVATSAAAGGCRSQKGQDGAKADEEDTSLPLQTLSSQLIRRRQREAGDAPLHVFRPGYLWVSDFSAQAWCEQQMEYSFTVPGVVKDEAMTTGSSLHLARELAVQDTVSIQVTSSEDIWAVKVLNLLGAINSFLAGVEVRREIPIFGFPFSTDIFVVGLIDEIRVDPDSFVFDLVEFKTRRSKWLPSKAQKLTHELQVMLYKQLFDDLVRGRVSPEAVAKALQLQLDESLGDPVVQMAADLGFSCTTLSVLMRQLLEKMQALPFITQCFIEYCYQTDQSTIAIQPVEFNQGWLQEQLKHHMAYWRGARPVEGVDIEDAWKCNNCTFADSCEWRQNKASEYQAKNLQNGKKLRDL